MTGVPLSSHLTTLAVPRTSAVAGATADCRRGIAVNGTWRGISEVCQVGPCAHVIAYVPRRRLVPRWRQLAPCVPSGSWRRHSRTAVAVPSACIA